MLFAAMALVRDLADHLEGLFVRLGAGVAVIDPVHARHLGQQLFGKQRAGHRAGGAAEKVHLDDGVAHRVADGFAPVADVDRPDPAGDRVDMFDAFLVPDLDPLALDDDLGVGAGKERLVLDQVMPHARAIRFDHAADVVFVERAVHGSATFR